MASCTIFNVLLIVFVAYSVQVPGSTIPKAFRALSYGTVNTKDCGLAFKTIDVVSRSIDVVPE